LIVTLMLHDLCMRVKGGVALFVLAQLYQFALSGYDFAGAHADKCESNQWGALVNRL